MVIAHIGREELEVLGKNRFQAVLTYWMMPNPNGIELIRKIRSLKTGTAILMIRVLASKEAKESIFCAGRNEYVAKPIDNSDVLKRLNNYIKRQYIETAKYFEDPFPVVR